MGNVDAKNFVHLPHWAKALALAAIAFGIAGSTVVVYAFLNTGGNRDWVLIGISGAQFMITTFVVTLILFYSQTDANISTLRKSALQFLDERGALGIALGGVTLADGTELTVTRGRRKDLFGFDYTLSLRCGTPVLRLWCGLNVNRFVVIYRFINRHPTTVAPPAFVERLKAIFRFSLGGAETVGYRTHYEGVPGAASIVSVWLTVATHEDLLTNPALKLFWSQDIAMMTESVLRTALRNGDDILLDVVTPPLPL